MRRAAFTGAAPVSHPGSSRGSAGASRAHADAQSGLEWKWPWEGVEWSVAYVGFLLYILVMTTYQLGVGDLAVATALGGLLFEKQRFRFPAFLALMAALILWAAVGYFVTPFPAPVYERVYEFGKLWLIALVAVNVLTTRARVRFFLIFWVACFMLYPMRGTLVNYFIGGYTWFGRALWNFIYRNPNDLAALTLLHLSIAAGLLVTQKHKWVRLGALASTLVMPLVILLTQSRGAFIGFATFGLLALAGQRQRMRALALGVVLGGVALLFVPSTAWERFGSLAGLSMEEEAIAEMDEEGSAEQRWEIWKTAMMIIGDNPVTGVGFGAYTSANALYAGTMDAASTNRGARDTHSTYLNVIAEIGWPGFVLFMTMIGVTLVGAEGKRRAMARSEPQLAQQIRLMQLGLIGFLIAGIFASYAKLAFLYLMLALLYAMATLPAEGARRRARRSGIGRAAGAYGPSMRA